MKSNQLRGRGRPHCLTEKQRVWISEYVIDMNGTRAARVAGYAHPDVAAAKLLNPDCYPLVVAEVKKALARKELVAERKADDVLRYIHAAMFFCPADYFDPGGRGGWLISQEDYRNLPPEIRCLVEEMELRTVKTPAGSVSTLWVRFVSKATAMTLAAKHQLGEKVSVTRHPWWEVLANGIPDGPVEDAIELKIASILERSASEAPVNRLGYVPSANGNGAGGR
jgi:hypothetical protein